MNIPAVTSEEVEISKPSRIAAIDFTRGLVVILMALDHASTYWNSGRVFGEFWFGSRPVPMPDLLQFLIRFVSHWCAPAFVFLAGTSIVLYESSRRKRDIAEKEITNNLIARGCVLLIIEWTLIGWLFSAGSGYFGVLAAIGVGLIIYAFLRRLSTKIVLGFSLFLVLSPLFAGFIWNPIMEAGSHPVNFSILYPGVILDPILSINPELQTWIRTILHWPQFPYGLYPLDPWLGVMGLGIVFGRWLLKQQEDKKTTRDISKKLGLTGGIALILFFFVRTLLGLPSTYFPIWSANGVLIENAFMIQNYFWMSKYPPSIVFLLWTLGGMCLALAAGFYLQENEKFQKWASGILLFGSTALFFYCTHLLIYGAVPVVLGLVKLFSIQVTLLVWILGLLILYPLCIRFKQIKRRYPHSLLKYI
ncbi:MAG: DUF1624 domain-containing protein [Candidatus Heimdallarchaeota archaeon]